MSRVTLPIVVLLVLFSRGALGDIVVPGADGSDGAFNPTDPNTLVDLSLAPTGTWNGPNPNPNLGLGIYDPVKWAVVFRYASVNIPAGVTVRFKNHPSRAPVVWLVSGSVTIAGTVRLDGADGRPHNVIGAMFAEPGPGGFRGGRGHQSGVPGTGGMGPGGATFAPGSYQCGDGSYGGAGASPTQNGAIYGNDRILPLIGGSGGGGYGRLVGGSEIDGGAGAGGGAILIAATSTVAISGIVSASGGAYGFPAGGGSGGAVRIVADSVAGTGTLLAVGGSSYYGAGGAGRLRIDSNTGSFNGASTPAIVASPAGATAQVWPDAAAPVVRVVSIDGVPAPDNPLAGFNFPLPDVQIATQQPIAVIEAQNVPLTWNMRVRVVPVSGPTQLVVATYQSGSVALSTWSATIPTLPNGVSAIQVRASQP